jgi:hypothetical protein
MAQPFTEEWMANLGRDDGAEVADWIVGELGAAETPSESGRVAESAVGRIHELVQQYEQRGVSAELVTVWRSACVAEIYRRFAALRESNDETPPDPVSEDRQGEA